MTNAVANGVGSRLLSLRFRGRAVPVTVVLLLGYLVARLLTTGFLAVFWAAASTGHWSTAHYDGGPGFLGFLSSWDSRWYERIALHGYPSTLPVDEVGDVKQSTWAFFPVFPVIVRGLTLLTGLDFKLASIAVAVLFGAGATVALHRVLLIRFRRTQALWGALFFAFSPFSFLLQVGYAESTFLCFLFIAIWFMMHRRYLAMLPFALVASFTHPGALALAAAIGFQGLHRLWRRHPIANREWITGCVAIAVIVAAALAWPVIVSTTTGDPSGYFDTELSWWRQYLGRVVFVPFTPFFLFYGALWGPIGYVVVAVVLAAIGFWMTRRSTRVYGADLWTFAASYMAYLVAVFLPTQSLLRQLLPLSPLLGHPGLSRTRRRRLITLAAFIASQPIAIYVLWVVYPP
ncbi:mannosyltransferase family protein [Lysinimonas soli]|uniref:Mannosyltransferase family protein n=1 Tax=Lysinimonas soli TaxID=1074233 RepID=A0ABW0NT47_9MICO